MAPFNSAGLVGFFGFGTLAVLWLATGWLAYRAIRRRDVASHRAWMMRNFALTYAAVTLRLWLGVLIAVQLLPGGDIDSATSSTTPTPPCPSSPGCRISSWPSG